MAKQFLTSCFLSPSPSSSLSPAPTRIRPRKRLHPIGLLPTNARENHRENRIAELDGISVKAFFKWWGITGIRSSGDNLVFEVGMVTAKYPSKNFDESPECEGKRSSS
nr:uncharacterized protein LOC109186882 [Ipomoea batatas]